MIRSTVIVAVFGLLCVCAPAAFGSSVVNFEPGVRLIDIGFDPNSREVVGVGYDDAVPTLFRVNADTYEVSRDEIVGIGSSVRLRAVSSDGSRIAGVSDQIGLTWRSAAPLTPVEIGSIDGVSPESSPRAAWRGGVAGVWRGGDGTSGLGPFTWSVDAGVQTVSGDIDWIYDVSANGDLLVGAQNPGFASYSLGGVVEPLRSSGGYHVAGYALAVSPNGEYIVGTSEFLYAPGSMVYELYNQPRLWVKNQASGSYDAIAADDERGEWVFGSGFSDVTDSGYAVGSRTHTANLDPIKPRGIIWDPDVEAVRSLDLWLHERSVKLSPNSLAFALSDDWATDSLILAVEGPSRFSIVFASKSVPEPTTLVAAVSLALGYGTTGSRGRCRRRSPRRLAS